MDGHQVVPDQDRQDATENQSPYVDLDGFSGPLAHLLALARARQVDLAQLSLSDLVDQLVVALQQAVSTVPLGQKANWVVMTAWLVQLRSLLLLPTETPARQAAAVEADQLRGQLITLRAMQAAADWLGQRRQLGRDVFARGQPEMFGVSMDDSTPAINAIAFLWASLALFDDEPVADTTNVYRPRPLELYDVAEARDRILQRLMEMPEGGSLTCFLPDPPDEGDSTVVSKVRLRSAWSSTLIACLELARQGDVVLTQTAIFQPIEIAQRHSVNVAEPIPST